MSHKPFQKFIDHKESGAKKKERIRQEKKKIRQETQAYFEKKKAEKRTNRNVAPPNERAGRKTEITREPDAKRKTPAPNKALLPKEKQVIPQMPLNKFIAHAGICSRRDAAELVKSGKVWVNGKSIIEPGFKVTDGDEVKVNGKKITTKKNLVYILLNKPKDYITTTDDPQGRKTVLDIVKNATTERVYPIGRLDRNTTGVLLLTNDGELAQKLSHPSYEVRKIYEVTLDKQLSKKDFETIAAGVTLEDGFIRPDAIAYPDIKNKHIIGIEIHSGRNRIVRRIFEHLGYDVRGLDRVMYAGLTKKKVDRGKWRFLSEKEVRLLKFLNNSYKKKTVQAIP
jgi:23S rRNA pseudouridine2605 synthase